MAITYLMIGIQSCALQSQEMLICSIRIWDTQITSPTLYMHSLTVCEIFTDYTGKLKSQHFWTNLVDFNELWLSEWSEQ